MSSSHPLTSRVAIDGDPVVVPDCDELPELEMSGEGAGLGSDTLLEASVTEEAVGVVVDDGLVVWLVERRGDVGLGHGKTDSVADTLA